MPETFADLFETIEPAPSFGDENINAEALRRAAQNFHKKIGYGKAAEEVSPVRSFAAAIVAAKMEGAR